MYRLMWGQGGQGTGFQSFMVLYARIMLLAWTIHRAQVLPAPWPAPYHGSCLEC